MLETEGGLQVRFARDDIDPSASDGRNIRMFMESFKATRDAATIRRNTMGGRHRRALTGKMPTSRVAWPYDMDVKKYMGEGASDKPVINNERAAWVRKWVTWILDDGVSLAVVCRRMDDAEVPTPEVQKVKERLLRKGHIHEGNTDMCGVAHAEHEAETMAFGSQS